MKESSPFSRTNFHVCSYNPNWSKSITYDSSREVREIIKPVHHIVASLIARQIAALSMCAQLQIRQSGAKLVNINQRVDVAQKITRYLTPGTSLTLPPRIKTLECSCKLCANLKHIYNSALKTFSPGQHQLPICVQAHRVQPVNELLQHHSIISLTFQGLLRHLCNRRQPVQFRRGFRLSSMLKALGLWQTPFSYQTLAGMASYCVIQGAVSTSLPPHTLQHRFIPMYEV